MNDDSADSPFDAGLQLERTLLAWRRTCLAIGVAAMPIVRFGIADTGVVSVAAGLTGVTLASIAYAAASRRYRRVHTQLTTNGIQPTASLPVAVTALSVTVFGLCGLAWLAVRTA